MEEDILILYVLMRRDVPDFLSGKAMAQANHAGTMFMRDVARRDRETYRSAGPEFEDFFKDFDEWLTAGDGFGTCVVLSVASYEMRVSLAQAHLAGIQCGVVHDPSYPIRDGDQVQHLPVDTCAYLFGRQSRLKPIVGRYPLFRSPGEA